MDTPGLTTIVSKHSTKVTIDRLAVAAQAMGMTIFARIDHAAGAAQVGLALRPTELLIFGNPLGGTALMQANQTAGIDLPLKMLAWQDETGQVLLGYDQAQWVAERHGLGPALGGAVAKLGLALAKLALTASD